MTAVTYNLAELFRMKLKTTKRYYSHLMEKTKEPFGPTNNRTEK